MLKIKILTIGKNKEEWLDKAISEYEKRLLGRLSVQWVYAKNDIALEKLIEKESSYITLDEKGQEFSSEKFSKKLFELFTSQGSNLTFVIGGAEGLSLAIKKRALTSLSLSKLTFTHQMIRVFFLEQLYRAFEIEKGSNYHK